MLITSFISIGSTGAIVHWDPHHSISLNWSMGSIRNPKLRMEVLIPIHFGILLKDMNMSQVG